jgi:hypothetical protein
MSLQEQHMLLDAGLLVHRLELGEAGNERWIFQRRPAPDRNRAVALQHAGRIGQGRCGFAIIQRAQPIAVSVSGKNTIILKDVLVGDVWICAGQSNMGFPLSGVDDAPAVMKSSSDDQLRLFYVTPAMSYQAKDDCEGHWARCSPASVPNFSAVGYFFGRSLRSDLKIPIGLVEISLGGTSVQSWTSHAGLEKRPALHDMLAAFDRDQVKLKAINDQYDNVTVPQWKKDDQEWRRDVQPAYQIELKKWNDDVQAAKASGQPAPPRPQPSKPHPGLAASLFHTSCGDAYNCG